MADLVGVNRFLLESLCRIGFLSSSNYPHFESNYAIFELHVGAFIDHCATAKPDTFDNLVATGDELISVKINTFKSVYC